MADSRCLLPLFGAVLMPHPTFLFGKKYELKTQKC